MNHRSVLLLGDPDSIHTKKWIEGWAYLGYEVKLSGLSKKNFDNLFIFNEDISSGGGNGRKYLKNLMNFYLVIKKLKPNILNAHFMTSYGLLAAILKPKKTKLVLFLPGTDVMKTMESHKVYLWMARYIFHKSDVIVSVSEVMTQKILLHFPQYKYKILTQQYGVNIEYLNKYIFSSKELDIVSNRQWKPNSNYEIIFDALKHFEDKKIVLIGNDNSAYAEALMNQNRNLEIYDKGIVPYEENLRYVGNSKVFISLTSSDGIPLSLIEAMYLGAIPIVSNIAPNKELIDDGVNGFVVDISSKPLEKIIQHVLTMDMKEQENIRISNHQIVLEKFDFHKNFDRLNYTIKKLDDHA